MTDAPTHHADALKYEDWAGEMGARWLANLTGLEKTIAPAGEALLAHAAYRPGERVLDIGFGGGATSLAIARAVAPGGEVVGIDISPALAAATARRAQVLLDYPKETQQAAAAELTALYAKHHRPEEGVMMGYMAWLVSAYG
ncbi:MAG: methyltransferase domain-containing protein [Novosphingobium sp.]